MKILIPNAKELNTNQDSFPAQPLGQKSIEILERLSEMSVEELARFYKVNPDKASVEKDRWYRLKHSQAKTYPAWTLYDGLMYRYMSRRDLSMEEEDYLRQNVFIATGFYGLINVFDLIAPHRLDFQGNLKIKAMGLKQFWRESYDALLGEDELLVSLLSSEFETVFSPSFQKRMISLVFTEEESGVYKTHSTISKKGRGRFVSEMARKNVQTVAELKKVTVDGFHYCPNLSSETRIVFSRQKH